MMGVLVVVAGPAAGRRVDLTGPVTIGRRDTEVVFEDQEISRRHCTIAPGPHSEVVITDLGSTNGTWVNGTRVAGPTVVRPGDEVRLGDCVCRLEAPVDDGTRVVERPGPAAAAAGPPPGGAPPAGFPPTAPQPPAPAAAPAAAYAPAAQAVGAAPAQPFGAFAPAASSVAAPVRRRRAAATRLSVGVAFAWTVVALDAAGLIVYFVAR